MMIETSFGAFISVNMLGKYFDKMIDKVFKILPILENKEKTINAYLENLESEIAGFNKLLPLLSDDPLYISLLCKTRWLIDNAADPEISYKKIRREVFNTISICNSLKERYLISDLGDESEVE